MRNQSPIFGDVQFEALFKYNTIYNYKDKTHRGYNHTHYISTQLAVTIFVHLIAVILDK